MTHAAVWRVWESLDKLLKPFWVDLHVHTTLSPCGELEMGAPEIVAAAREAGLDIIAITDHNSLDNWEAVEKASGGTPLVLPGIEVQTAEDVHLVSLFEEPKTAQVFKEWLWERMPQIPNDPDIFGYQVIIDSENQIIGMEDTLLIQVVGYEVDTIIEKIHALNGLAILAHVDRPSFSYPANLGPIPFDYPVDALELSRRMDNIGADVWRGNYPDRVFVRSSDSHELHTLKRTNGTKMILAEPSFEEIRKAFLGKDGRRVVWPWG